MRIKDLFKVPPNGVNLINFCGSESYRETVLKQVSDPILKGIHQVHKEKIIRNVKELALCSLALINGETDRNYYKSNQTGFELENIQNSLKVKKSKFQILIFNYQ